MINKIISKINNLFNGDSVQFEWFKQDESSWLASFVNNYSKNQIKFDQDNIIGKRTNETANLGKKPLWEKYKNLANYRKSEDMIRDSTQVSIAENMGSFFVNLVVAKKPQNIIEFGTAFGISGMYWLSGLNGINQGKLLTFEPNKLWADIAINNLKSISNRYKLIQGTFEDNLNVLKNNKIDIGFIDAIHTDRFVSKQFKLVASKAKSGSIILIDDIDFSEDMNLCWEKLAFLPIVKSSVSVNKKAGVIEIR